MRPGRAPPLHPAANQLQDLHQSDLEYGSASSELLMRIRTTPRPPLLLQIFWLFDFTMANSSAVSRPSSFPLIIGDGDIVPLEGGDYRITYMTAPHNGSIPALQGIQILESQTIEAKKHENGAEVVAIRISGKDMEEVKRRLNMQEEQDRWSEWKNWSDGFYQDRQEASDRFRIFFMGRGNSSE
ncbi:hypothetical protein DPSP01_013381 [Paraphaeosphaeria sporulosa]